MKKLEPLIILVFFGLFILCQSYDLEIIKFIASQRTAGIDRFALFITNTGLYIGTTLLITYLFHRKKYTEIALIALSAAISLEMTYLLKKIFQSQRPFHYSEILTAPLIFAHGYAFPSLHAAFSFSIIPFIRKIIKNRVTAAAMMAFFVAIALSRTYIGVHFASDIIIGGIIGYTVSRVLIHLQGRFSIFQKFVYHFKDKLEVRRQTIHMTSGVLLVLLIHWNLVNAEILSALIVVGVFLSMALKKYEIPAISKLLKIFERENQLRKFPGKGPIFLLLGALLSILLFEKKIALAAISVMAVGDAIAPIFGLYFGKYLNPLNKNKHLDAVVVAIVFSTAAAFTFVDFQKALAASAAGMIFEAFTIKSLDRILDDNVLIPLIAGGVMTLMT